MGIEYRYRQSAAMERAKTRIDEIDREFGEAFGRSYGGQIEAYRGDDSEILIVAVGSSASTAKVAVDNIRERGVKAGLLNLRMVRPFPAERFRELAEGKKAVGVIDRNICFGWGCGTLFMEMKAALYDLELRPKVISLVSGLCGLDITVEKIMRAIDLTNEAAAGRTHQEVTWLDLE
jgi:pyruvate/2-oxoacid:ferredoxin oxidoreductase alpha subunit